MEVLTADRVVGQTITKPSLAGYVPTISFLGTRFENLRIAGFPVEVEFDHNIFGPMPADDAPYTHDTGVISRVARQYIVSVHTKIFRQSCWNGTMDYPHTWQVGGGRMFSGQPGGWPLPWEALGTSSGFPALGSLPWPS